MAILIFSPILTFGTVSLGFFFSLGSSGRRSHWFLRNALRYDVSNLSGLIMNQLMTVTPPMCPSGSLSALFVFSFLFLETDAEDQHETSEQAPRTRQEHRSEEQAWGAMPSGCPLGALWPGAVLRAALCSHLPSPLQYPALPVTDCTIWSQILLFLSQGHTPATDFALGPLTCFGPWKEGGVTSVSLEQPGL